MIEHWKDIVNRAAASIGGAVGLGNGIQNMILEITKTEGYVLWNSVDDEYLSTRFGSTREHNKFAWVKGIPENKISSVLFIGWEIDHIQDIIGGLTMDVDPLMYQIYGEIKEIGDAICIVPCVAYDDERIELDFLHVLSFSWE